MEKKRINWIDYAKGFGILCVIFGHNIDSAIGHKWVYTFHMPMFFVLSGMIICLKQEQKQTMKEIFLKKMTTLIYPYVGFSIMMNVIAYIGLRFFNYSSWVAQSMEYFSINVMRSIIGDGVGTLWFLPALFWGELLFLLVLKINKKVVNIAAVVIVLVNSYVMSFHLNMVEGITNHLLHLLVSDVMKWIVAFSFVAIGYTSFNVVKKITTEMDIVKKIAFGIGALLVNCLLGMNNSVINLFELEIGNLFLYYGAAVTGTFFVIIICSMINNINYLRYIGVNSLLYMAVDNNSSDNKLLKWIWYDVFGINNDMAFLFFLFVGIQVIEGLFILIMKHTISFTYNWTALMKLFRLRKVERI